MLRIGGYLITIIYPTFHVEKLKRIIQTTLDDDKAEDIVSLNLAGKSSLADYMIVASGTSQRHMQTLAEHVAQKLRAIGYDFVTLDGMDSEEWIVVDAGDVLVHLMRPDARRTYNLEKMWGADLSATAEVAV
jgi:ribosome-associated protein